jgi:hypothetical protein
MLFPPSIQSGDLRVHFTTIQSNSIQSIPSIRLNSSNPTVIAPPRVREKLLTHGKRKQPPWARVLLRKRQRKTPTHRQEKERIKKMKDADTVPLGMTGVSLQNSLLLSLSLFFCVIIPDNFLFQSTLPIPCLCKEAVCEEDELVLHAIMVVCVCVFAIVWR